MTSERWAAAILMRRLQAGIFIFCTRQYPEKFHAIIFRSSQPQHTFICLVLIFIKNILLDLRVFQD